MSIRGAEAAIPALVSGACPNCKGPCYLHTTYSTGLKQVKCGRGLDAACGYCGPFSSREEEAIRLHNAICDAPDDGKGQPVAANPCECGEKPSHIYEDKYGDWRIHCASCRNGTIGGTREACIRRWNSGQYNNRRITQSASQGWQQGAALEICRTFGIQLGETPASNSRLELIEAILKRWEEKA